MRTPADWEPTPVPVLSARAACADPAIYPLVDAAFTRPGGDAGRVFGQVYCAPCPAAADCLQHAMTHREHGVWAATTPTARSRAGAPGTRGGD